MCIKKELLHNDIKGDNVLLTAQISGLHPILIDFGKCRKVSNAKKYTLTSQEQRRYFKCHSHIAPELKVHTASHMHLTYTHLEYLFLECVTHCLC